VTNASVIEYAEVRPSMKRLTKKIMPNICGTVGIIDIDVGMVTKVRAMPETVISETSTPREYARKPALLKIAMPPKKDGACIGKGRYKEVVVHIGLLGQIARVGIHYTHTQ